MMNLQKRDGGEIYAPIGNWSPAVYLGPLLTP